MVKMKKGRKRKARDEKKSTVKHLYWLIGGLIGVALGILIGFYILTDLDLPYHDLYITLYHSCAIIILLSVLFGATLGAVINKIILLLKEPYKKKTLKNIKNSKT